MIAADAHGDGSEPQSNPGAWIQFVEPRVQDEKDVLDDVLDIRLRNAELSHEAEDEGALAPVNVAKMQTQVPRAAVLHREHGQTTGAKLRNVSRSTCFDAIQSPSSVLAGWAAPCAPSQRYLESARLGPMVRSEQRRAHIGQRSRTAANLSTASRIRGA